MPYIPFASKNNQKVYKINLHFRQSMKTLYGILLASSLFMANCSPKEEPASDNEVPVCSAPNDYVSGLNLEVATVLESYSGESMCKNILYSSLAHEKYSMVLDQDGPIYLSELAASLESDELFSLLAHEYGHLFHRHPFNKPYVDYLTEKYLCTDPDTVQSMESQADYFSGALTAASGRPAEPYVNFLESISESEFWNQPCVEQYYPSEERVRLFSLGYQNVVEGF